MRSDESVELEAEMARALGYTDVAALRHTLRQLEQSGMVRRETRGRRTVRIELAGEGPGRDEEEGRAGETDPASADLRDELCHPKGHLKACLLLLLDHSPGHGWELRNQLKPLGYGGDDPARVYRALHWLEEAALVRSDWQTSGPGPARRVYALTPAGRQMARVCARSMEERSRALQPHLQPQGTDPTTGEGPDRDRSFEVLVEAKLWVRAPDEAGARGAVERALSHSRMVDPDVRATGQIWVYDIDAVSEEHQAG